MPFFVKTEIIKKEYLINNAFKRKIIKNWSHFKSTFKLIVPPSEEEMLGINKM